MQKHISVFRTHCRAPVSLQGLEGASLMGDIPVQPSGTVPWPIIWPLIPVRLQYFLGSAVCVNSTSHSFPPERSTRWWLGFVAHVAALPEAQPGRIRACGVRGEQRAASPSPSVPQTELLGDLSPQDTAALRCSGYPGSPCLWHGGKNALAE